MQIELCRPNRRGEMRRTLYVGALLAVFAAAIVVASEPSANEIQTSINAAYDKYKDLQEGKNADYTPALAKVDPSLYGIALVTLDGKTYTAGDVKSEVSIQSISKVFTLALVLHESGATAVVDNIGVDPTGRVFNSIEAIEQHKGKEINPFVTP